MKIKPRDYQAEAVQLLFRTLKHDLEQVNGPEAEGE